MPLRHQFLLSIAYGLYIVGRLSTVEKPDVRRFRKNGPHQAVAQRRAARAFDSGGSRGMRAAATAAATTGCSGNAAATATAGSAGPRLAGSPVRANNPNLGCRSNDLTALSGVQAIVGR